MRTWVWILIGACSSSPTAPVVDSGAKTPDATGNGMVVDDVQCQTRTLTITLASGAKLVSDFKFALVSGVDPTNFAIESCDQVQTATDGSGNVTTTTAFSGIACPAGDTCTTTGMQTTGTHACQFSHEGLFIDGALEVSCGSTTTNFDPTGKKTNSTDTSYGAVRVHH